MRRLSAVATLAFITGCASRDEALRLDETAIMLSAADPRADKQLVKGFFPVETGGRWTGRTFSVVLKPPPTAARKGAVLLLRFGIGEQSMGVLHSIKISAAVNGVTLPPEEYIKVGEHDYTRDVPSSAFRNEGNATVDFALDKALPPTGPERRELGVIVNMVGFESK